MKKEWYIFLNSTHIGPYTLKELRDFYDKRDIKDTTMVWKEGMNEWITLKKADFFSPVLVDVPPPLPPDVFQPKVKSIEPLSVPSILKKIEKKVEVEETESEIKKNYSVARRIFFAVLGIIFCFALFIIYQNVKSPDLHLKSVSPFNRQQLENQVSIDSRNLSFALALSMDRSNLWVSSNQKEIMSVVIDLKSIPGRILADEDKNSDTLIRIQGMIINHLGHFTSMRILKGTKFFPGEYNVLIKGQKIHWINKYLKLNMKELNQEFRTEFSSLIYSGNSREFERKLTERKLEKLNQKLKPFLETLESLQTLKSLAEKNKSLFTKNLEIANKGSDFLSFEKDYIKEIGQVLQEIVLSAQRDSNQEVAESGKKIAGLSSEFISQITKSKKLNSKNKKKFNDEFLRKLQLITDELSLKITSAEEKIKAEQNPL